MIRVELPYHLRTLANIRGEVTLDIAAPVTQRQLLDALEELHPVLRGTIRDYHTQLRRPFLRFYACEQDYTLADPDEPLPEAVATGKEPFLIIGGLAGG